MGDTDTTWARGPLMPNPNLPPLPTPMLMPKPLPGTDIMDILIMDTMVDTDIPMPVLMATTSLERGLLTPNPRLMLLPMPMPNPGTDTTVDTMVIPTEATTPVPTDTMAATGGNFLTCPCSAIF